MKKESDPMLIPMPNESVKEFEGKEISILLGGAVAHSAVVVRMLHGHCDTETEKAIKLQLDKGFLWLPKKALAVIKSNYSTDVSYRLAKWFKFSRQQDIIVERNESISGQSNA